MKKYLLECCVDSAESALAAEEGGADRLELCSGLVIGGLSPGPALFEEIRSRCTLPIRVLLRPRFGDFLYTEYEFRVILREVEMFKKAGAEGVVIGCLKRDGSLDMERMEELVSAAGGMKVTLHRAFDLCADPMETYERAERLGIDTILTSGQEKDAESGFELIRRLAEKEKKTGGPKIMAGAGVNPGLIRRFLEESEVTCFHLSAKKVQNSGMIYRREGVPMGIPGMDEYSIFRTDPQVVAQAKAVLAALEKI